MADNDCVIQVYLPDSILEQTVRAWLLEQPIEEEAEGQMAGGVGNEDGNVPF